VPAFRAVIKRLCAGSGDFSLTAANRLFLAIRLLPRLLSGLADIDTAFEECAIFDGDACG